jgi:indolepyruvate ferredoxin oxidoreductase alpha subunit
VSVSKGTKKVLLMGNEAIARGAIEAGVQVVASYPGTPSSEVTESLIEQAPDFGYKVEWSTNEKVAFEVAAGASLVGARSLTAMKNAGLNVVMDTFMTIPYGGCKGGFVVVVADDPDAHYSSTEQDSRVLAAYAEILCMEPADQQEAKDMTLEAFEISEQIELPVVLRSVSRISHASGDVVLGDVRESKNNLGFNKHYKVPYRWNVYGPPGPRSKHEWLHGQRDLMKKYSEESQFNKVDLVEGAKVGVIGVGLGASYAREAMQELDLTDKISFLKIGITFPLPEQKLISFLKTVDRVAIVEEGDPVVENMIRTIAQINQVNVEIVGKNTIEIYKPWGELDPDYTRKGLADFMQITLNEDKERQALEEEISSLVTPRSSTLCPGCSHLGTYWAVRKVLQKIKGVHIVNGDIGCYEQGGYGSGKTHKVNSEDSQRYPRLSPYEVLDTIHVMGSGIGLAQGQVAAGYEDGKILAVCGDSTFFHAVLPSIVNAVYNKADITFLILDNRWTAMTGHQPNPSTGVNAEGPVEPADILGIVKALGVENIRKANAYNLPEAEEAVSEAINSAGLSVVVLEGECKLQFVRRNKITEGFTAVEQDLCDGCKTCVTLGCSSIKYDVDTKKASIDSITCCDCGLCIQVCPTKAINNRRVSNVI